MAELQHALTDEGCGGTFENKHNEGKDVVIRAVL